MKARFPAVKRKELVLQLLQKHGHVTIADIAKICRASEMTLRRDLDKMAEEGLLTRTFGGASALEQSALERVAAGYIAEGAMEQGATAINNSENEIKIAQRAAREVDAYLTIALGSGMIASELARNLRGINIRVVANSLGVISVLNGSRVSTYVLCGRVAGSDPSIIGAQAVNHLRNFSFDIAFIDASGLTAEGIYDTSFENAEIKKEMMAQARQTIILADSSKFDKTAAARIDVLDNIDKIIVDEIPEGTLARALITANVEMVLANDEVV